MSQEMVRRIKRELVSLARSGEASRLRGLIVSPEVWAALSQEEGFDGRIGVTGMEGTRRLRYGFYVLCNPNFPTRCAEPYFFVHHPQEVYEERYLG